MLEERLPPAERPGQHDLSTAAYLQIAAKIPPDRIIVLNLEKFQRLVFATYNELYSVCARYVYPRNITVDRFLEISHIVVRDPLHILSREPPALHLPAPSSLMAPAHLLSQPAEVLKTIQFLAYNLQRLPPAPNRRSPTLPLPTRVLLRPLPPMPPASESMASGAQTPPSASASTSGTACQLTSTPSRAQVLEPSVSSTLGARIPSANASAASASASMPSDANLQEPGAVDEPFTHDTGTGFDSSAYSEVLDRGLADIRTPVIPYHERPAQPEAPRKKVAEPAAKHKHTKRARRHSPTKSKASAVSMSSGP